MVDELSINILRFYVKDLYDNNPMPLGTVLDFGWNPKDDWFLIEQNQSWASSIYSCDPDKCLDSIVGSIKTIR